MKSYTMYVCENCGKESRNRKIIQECEAGHLGLTWLEYLDYRNLKGNVNMFEILLKKSISTNDEQWRIDGYAKSVKDAKTAVANFEVAHGIPSVTILHNK